VPRSGVEARRRLQGAALELWAKRGYERTTTAEIAAHAGVSERTFFRHFPDKREVLFDGSSAMRSTLAEALAKAPAGEPALKALNKAFEAVGPLFEMNQPYSAIRQRIIAETPALQEREWAKAALLTTTLAEALKARGIEARLAALAAQTGMAAFNHAFDTWLARPNESFLTNLNRAFEQLTNLCANNTSSKRLEDK